MMTLEEIRDDLELVNAIDWDMSPEMAVTLYLEWGNNWNRGRMVKSPSDESLYFTVNSWDDPPQVYLIRRNSEAAEELASIPLPVELRHRFLRSIGGNKGVYPLTPEIKTWIRNELGLEEDWPSARNSARTTHRMTRH